MLRALIPAVVSFLILASTPAGPVPGLVSHHGRLLDAAGEPVADGTYTMTFRFYDACVEGNVLMAEVHSVVIEGGVYSVLLGGGERTAGIEPGLLEVFGNHPVVCLGTQVDGDSEMQPRQPVVSVPYALSVGSAASLAGDPAPCPPGTFVTDTADDGTLTCAEVRVEDVEHALTDDTPQTIVAGKHFRFDPGPSGALVIDKLGGVGPSDRALSVRSAGKERTFIGSGGRLMAFDGQVTAAVPNLSSTGAAATWSGDHSFLGTTQVMTAKIVNGTLYCGADWDGDGVPGQDADVVTCLQSALARVSSHPAEFDNAVTVKLPDGYFDVSSACSEGSCFELKSGIRIVGEMPRLRYLAGQAPDLNMRPDGGSWLDPGPENTLFTGKHLRGVVLERFGVANFGRVARFGGDGEDGISFSVIRDVYASGTDRTASPRSTDAWVLYNIQHVRMDHVKVYNVERGLHIIGQHSAWQPANSVISDFYVYTYPNPQGGIRLEVLPPTVGEAKMMNYITFVRPQVNGFSSNGGPGVTGILLKGHTDTSPVQLMSFLGADVEGTYEVAIRLENADHNLLQIAALPSAEIGVKIDGQSQFNTIESLHDRVSLDVTGQNHNVFFGHFESTEAALIHGLVWDRQHGRWSASLGPAGRVRSGSGNLWFDDAAGVWKVAGPSSPGEPLEGRAVVTASGSSATRGPVLWTDPGVSCSVVCTSAGMSGCVEAWAGASTVGCAATADRRICACR